MISENGKTGPFFVGTANASPVLIKGLIVSLIPTHVRISIKPFSVSFPSLR